MNFSRVILITVFSACLAFGAVPNTFAMDKACTSGLSQELKDKIVAMAERSKKEKKGLTLYLAGQSVSVIVTEVIGTEAIVGKNREYDQVLIRLDRVLAYAMN